MRPYRNLRYANYDYKNHYRHSVAKQQNQLHSAGNQSVLIIQHPFAGIDITNNVITAQEFHDVILKGCRENTYSIPLFFLSLSVSCMIACDNTPVSHS